MVGFERMRGAVWHLFGGEMVETMGGLMIFDAPASHICECWRGNLSNLPESDTVGALEVSMFPC